MSDAGHSTSTQGGAVSALSGDDGKAASPGTTPAEWLQSWRDGEVVGPPDRPELAVGAAFAAGVLVALILRRLGR
jgi:hypothetical protein